MRDLLSKLDAIVSETELKNPEDLQAKRKALADLEKDPVASGDPEISSAITQRKTDLEREAKSKGFSESFEVGDEFGISFSEDHEIATTIVDILEDGIVIELDDLAMEMLTNEGLNFLEGELVEDNQKGVDGKACWKGYKRMGTKQKGGKTVDNCVKMEDHGPENPDAPVNYGEYDREGDMAKDDLRTIDDAAEELYSILRADDNLPEWVQSKITKAVDYIDTARDYMKAQKYEEGVAESQADQVKKIVKKNGKPVGEIGTDPEASPGNGNWYVKHYASGYDVVGFDNAEEALAELKHVMTQGVAEGAMPASVIRIKEKIRLMSDDEKKEYFKGKTREQLQQMARRHGYGENSDVYAKYATQGVDEAKYQGREVPLGKKMAGDVKKSKVYVRKPNGNIVKVNFGDKKMRIKKSNPARRKSFRARHNCANPGPRHKARYWSCRSW